LYSLRAESNCNIIYILITNIEAFRFVADDSGDTYTSTGAAAAARVAMSATDTSGAAAGAAPLTGNGRVCDDGVCSTISPVILDHNKLIHNNSSTQ
jgi:hypothetical protein